MHKHTPNKFNFTSIPPHAFCFTTTLLHMHKTVTLMIQV